MWLSIITINKNNKTGLEKTINSVLNQTFRNFEYIIIDGGSTDGSKRIIQNNEKQLKYWESNLDDGIYFAMNKGLSHSSAEYCLFLNSGDIFCDDNVLAKISREASGEDIIYGDILREGQIIKSPEKVTFFTLRWSTIPHPATMIRRNLILDLGKYDERYRIAADWHFWLKSFIIANCSYKHIPLLITDVERAGISGVVDPQYNEGYEILNSLFPQRVLEDYERFKDTPSIGDQILLNQILKTRLLKKVLKCIFRVTSRN